MHGMKGDLGLRQITIGILLEEWSRIDFLDQRDSLKIPIATILKFYLISRPFV